MGPGWWLHFWICSYLWWKPTMCPLAKKDSSVLGYIKIEVVNVSRKVLLHLCFIIVRSHLKHWV